MLVKIKRVLFLCFVFFSSNQLIHGMDRPVGVPEFIAQTGILCEAICYGLRRDKMLDAVTRDTFSSGRNLTVFTGLALCVIENVMVSSFKNSQPQFLASKTYTLGRTVCAALCGSLVSGAYPMYFQLKQNQVLAFPYVLGLISGAACICPLLYPCIRLLE